MHLQLDNALQASTRARGSRAWMVSRPRGCSRAEGLARSPQPRAVTRRGAHLLVPHLGQVKIGCGAQSSQPCPAGPRGVTAPGQRRDGDLGGAGGTGGPCRAPAPAAARRPAPCPAEQKPPLRVASGEKCRRKLTFPTKSRSQTVRNEAHGEILPAVYFTLL